MSFLAGFATGIIATYVLSIAALLYFLRHERKPQGDEVVIEERVCPEYPTVKFTHVTSIGSYVRGRGD